MPHPVTRTRTYPRSQFQALHNLTGFSLSPDGTELAYISDVTGSPNLWLRDLTHPGMPRQLTTFVNRAVRNASWLPDGSGLAFTADRDGDENTQLFRITLDRSTGGLPLARWPEVLVSQPGRRVRLPDGPLPQGPIPFASNLRDPGVFDIFTFDPESRSLRQVWTPPASESGITRVSPDGRTALVSVVFSNTIGVPYRVDLQTGEAESLMPAPPAGEEVMEAPVGMTADGRTVYVLSNRSREFFGLLAVDTVTGAQTWLATPEHDIDQVEPVPQSDRLFYVVNQDGASRGFLLDPATGRTAPVTDLGAAVVWHAMFAPDGQSLLTLGESAVFPRSIRRARTEGPGAAVETLVESWITPIPEDALVTPEPIRLTAPDGVSFTAWLYQPREASPATPVPIVLSIHGGPESQERPVYAYEGFYQYLATRGIAVIAPNVRGSTGFGKSFQKRIHRDWGGGELEDLRTVASFMATRDWVDPARMAVFGGSFGGFATLSVISRLPEFRWAGAVSICGPSNLVSFTQSVPPSWRPIMKGWVGDPEEDREMLLARSPITYASQVTAPLLVLQGAKDPRVVQAESDQMVEAVRKNGTEVVYEIFPDEGHGFAKRANILRAFGLALDFLEHHLTDASDVVPDLDGELPALP